MLVRVVELTAGLATSEAIGRALGRLARSKRVVVYLPQVNMRSMLVAAEVSEVVAPESAEVMLSRFRGRARLLRRVPDAPRHRF